MPTTIVDYNKEVINFLEDVNYGMSQPQFNHLATMVEGCIHIDGKVSISKIAEHIAKAKDESCIYRFLSQSPWDESLLNRNRISFLEYHLDHNIQPGQVGFLVIDDTVNLKNIKTQTMGGLDFHYSHTEGKTCWSHCVVTSNFVAGPYSVPLHFKPYYREGKCKEVRHEFKSKVEIAKDFVKTFNPPTNLKQLYILTDSWYTGTPLIEESLSKAYHLIGGVKPNRTISPCGIKLKISAFTEYLDPNTLDVVTVKGKNYRVYRYEGKVASFDNAVLLISYEITKGGFNNPVCILCTDIDLSTETILRYYSVRWTVETNYQYLKENLGFDQYRVRSLISIERYMLLCFLAYNFLEIYRVTQEHLCLDTIGDTIRYHKKETAIGFVEFIYTQAINNIPLEDVCMQLKLVA
jgi:SRSO17 transposase